MREDHEAAVALEPFGNYDRSIGNGADLRAWFAEISIPLLTVVVPNLGFL